MSDENESAIAESAYRSRKFIITVASLVVSAFALFFDFLNGEQFVDIIPMILGIYATGNVAGYFVANKGK